MRLVPADLPSLTTPELTACAVTLLVLVVIGWLIQNTDRLMHAAFPDLEWERNLGWLNIRAERRAHRAMRWVGYGIVVLLVDSLFGIYWALAGMPRLSDWSDPWIMGDLALRVPGLALCLLIWILYLGCGLLPRLRAEKEAAAYRKFRAQWVEDEARQRDPESASRVNPPPPRPRASAPPAKLLPGYQRRRFPPGG